MGDIRPEFLTSVKIEKKSPKNLAEWIFFINFALSKLNKEIKIMTKYVKVEVGLMNKITVLCDLLEMRDSIEGKTAREIRKEIDKGLEYVK